MFPRISMVFKSRWLALFWAAGIIWLAIDVAGPDPARNGSTDASHPTDVTGATITNEDLEQFSDFANR
jgi:hypothetical protein